ncbi:hypothetical protein [Paraflavitalea speifideaquila]|uniref:hypothetical protein n=1 Tax=Paraflavitalea speifideaquila TaxID=3076558 RepID=UPI0028EAF6F8|nr:hypothetical protein [Paraflavitalea speifideiaquila]
MFSTITDALVNHQQSVYEEMERIFTSPEFKQSYFLSADALVDRAYKRLGFVASELKDIKGLITHPHRLFLLHRWAAMTDTSLAVILTIHYNLCSGTILDHGGNRADVKPYLQLLEQELPRAFTC